MSKRFDDAELRAAYSPKLEETRATRGADCPSPDALLGALNGEGAEPTRLQILDHALSCAHCRPELALLHAVSGVGSESRASAAPRMFWRRIAPLAAAASVVLAVGIVGLAQWRQRTDDTMRAGGSDGPALITPRGAASVAGGSVTFAWHPVTNAIRYTLEVDAPDGSVLFSTSTADTTVVAGLQTITPGERRWLVRAHLDDGREVRSEVRVVRLR